MNAQGLELLPDDAFRHATAQVHFRSKRGRWYLYGKSAGLVTGGTNGKVDSEWGRFRVWKWKWEGGIYVAETVRGRTLESRTVMWPVDVFFL